MPAIKLTDCDKAIIRRIVGQLHVSEPDLEVCQVMASKVPNASPALLRLVCAEAVRVHRANQCLYRAVVSGRF